MESQILSALMFNKEAYDELSPIISESDFSDQSKVILKEIVDFYKKDTQATSVDKTIVLQRLERKYKHQYEHLKIVMDGIVKSSIPNVIQEYLDMRIHSMSMRLGGLLVSGTHNSETDELLLALAQLKERREELLKEDRGSELFNSTSIEDLFEEVKESNLLKLYPKSLNAALGGGITRPTHIVVFARPNAGKSLTALSFASDFLRQGFKVLYIGNEDGHQEMLRRFISNLSGMTKTDILCDYEEAKNRAYESGYANLHFLKSIEGTIDEIRRNAEKVKPDIIVVDQLRNIITNGKLSKAEGLDYITRNVRHIGKEFNTITISVTQAGEPAEGKLRLSMTDIDSSKTGIQAGCDIMIGLGMNNDFKEQDKRMISIVKAKQSLEQEFFPVRVVRELSRLEDF